MWETIVNLWNAADGAYRLYIVVSALLIPFIIFGLVASLKVNSTFAKYSQVDSGIGKTAADVAREVLDKNGLSGVRVVQINGNLTDNFNPTTNVLSLSQTVYGSTSAAAIGVACHEAGHAIQHSKKYFFSRLRLKMVPVLNIADKLLWPIFIIGMVLGFMDPNNIIGFVCMVAGLTVLGGSMLFALVTLPTEFDASNRAKKILSSGYLSGSSMTAVNRVLNAAAMTYVASFMMASLQFLRILAIFLLRRNRR